MRRLLQIYCMAGKDDEVTPEGFWLLKKPNWLDYNSSSVEHCREYCIGYVSLKITPGGKRPCSMITYYH